MPRHLITNICEWENEDIEGTKYEAFIVSVKQQVYALQLSLFPEEQRIQLQKPEKVTVPEHKRRIKRTHDDWMETLAIEEVKHQEEHPVCENCGAEMKEIGKEKAYDELVYTPAKYHIRRHIVYTYKCPDCGEKPENDASHADDIEHCHIRRANYPKPMIPGSFCSPELLAHIVYEKYANAVPLH